MIDHVYLGSKIEPLTVSLPARACPRDWQSVWGEFTCVVEAQVPPDFRVPSIEETAGLHFERKFQFECKMPFTVENVDKIKQAYARAGREIACHGSFCVGMPFEEKSANQSESYSDCVRVTAYRGSYDEKVIQRIEYSVSKGPISENPKYAFQAAQQIIQACGFPVQVSLEENTIRFTADDSATLVVKEFCPNKAILLEINLPDLPFEELIGNGHAIARDLGKRFWNLEWATGVFIKNVPTRAMPLPQEQMVFHFLNHMKQAALPAEGQVLEFHAKIKNPQGLGFIQSLCGPLDQVEVPVYSIPMASKWQKCYATLMVEAGGTRWALRSSHALDELQILDFGQKLGVKFSPQSAVWQKNRWVDSTPK